MIYDINNKENILVGEVISVKDGVALVSILPKSREGIYFSYLDYTSLNNSFVFGNRIKNYLIFRPYGCNSQRHTMFLKREVINFNKFNLDF